MAHRNGNPKPSATERTKYRHRVRHDIETVEDTKRLGITDFIKNRIYQFRHPEEFEE